MPTAAVAALTRDDVSGATKRFPGGRASRWTTRIGGREFPARPLVLYAARVLPNDPTNSHQAVAVLQALGFDVYYDGKLMAPPETAEEEVEVADANFVSKLRGCCKGDDSLVEALQRGRRSER
jgi:hypothetical protein